MSTVFNLFPLLPLLHFSSSITLPLSRPPTQGRVSCRSVTTHGKHSFQTPSESEVVVRQDPEHLRLCRRLLLPVVPAADPSFQPSLVSTLNRAYEDPLIDLA